MIQLLLPGATSLRPADARDELPSGVLWIDLLEPDRDTEARVERFLGINIPTREEMREIEESSRLYRQDEALYMTVRVLFGLDTGRPRTRAITFVLTPRCLVTVRYIDPVAFRGFGERFTKDHAPPLGSGAEVFVELLERIVDRSADVLEGVEADLERVSDAVFREDGPDEISLPKTPTVTGARVAGGRETDDRLPATVDLQLLLKRLGRHNALGARLRESLLSISRLMPFLCGSHAPLSDDLRERIETVERDVKSLSEYDAQVAQEIEFLLDATLGFINLEQNAIIKVFTVAATLLMPPTVVGSIYGMNFEHMPELHWRYGYAFALALMVLSAVVPYWYFKRKGWM